MSHYFSLDNTKISAGSSVVNSAGNGLFISGASLTGPDDSGQEQIVPATWFTGTVPAAELATFADTVPPGYLIERRVFTKLSDIVIGDQLLQKGGRYYQPGVPFLGKHDVMLTVLNSDGLDLIRNYVLHTDESDEMAEALISRLGLGDVVVFKQGDIYRARRILCYEDN